MSKPELTENDNTSFMRLCHLEMDRVFCKVSSNLPWMGCCHMYHFVWHSAKLWKQVKQAILTKFCRCSSRTNPDFKKIAKWSFLLQLLQIGRPNGWSVPQHWFSENDQVKAKYFLETTQWVEKWIRERKLSFLNQYPTAVYQFCCKYAMPKRCGKRERGGYMGPEKTWKPQGKAPMAPKWWEAIKGKYSEVITD